MEKEQNRVRQRVRWVERKERVRQIERRQRVLPPITAESLGSEFFRRSFPRFSPSVWSERRRGKQPRLLSYCFSKPHPHSHI